MKKPNLLLTLIKLFATLVVSWLGFLFIAAALAGGGEISPTATRWASLSAFVFTFLITIGLNFMRARRLQTHTKKLLSDIKVQKKRSTSLLEKANKVVDKYTKHESDVQKDVAKSISGSREFESVITRFPDLKANESIMKLLQQLEQSENIITSAKLEYNNAAAEYNNLVHASSLMLIGRVAKFEDLDYYKEQQDDVSDEDLGI